MKNYQAFLIPLLEDSERLELVREEPSNTLHEERLMRRCNARIWTDLQHACKEHYGLPLLSHKELPGRNLLIERSGTNGTGRCALRVMDDETAYFVMAHPEDLPLFDAYGKLGDLAVLARPTLFADLLTRAQSAPDPAAVVEIPAAMIHTINKVTESPGVKWLRQRVEANSPSDWHLEPKRDGFIERERVDGRLREPHWLNRSQGEWLINVLLRESGLGDAQQGNVREGRLDLQTRNGKSVGVRLSFIPALHGTCCAVRFLYPHTPASQQWHHLGMSFQLAETLRSAFAKSQGLWLTCGPTGSGKTTTLHALLRYAVERGEKVVAVEDPVEQLLPGVQQVSVGQPRGLTFPMALRAFMRQAPQCILIGEIRDAETAELTLQAVRTGHRVLASVHAYDTGGVIRRMEDLGISRAEFLSVEPTLIHQRLQPRLCHCCRRIAPLLPEEMREIRAAGIKLREQVFEAGQCKSCRQGHRGRFALYRVESFVKGLRLPPFEEELLFHLYEGELSIRDLKKLIKGIAHPIFTLSPMRAVC